MTAAALRRSAWAVVSIGVGLLVGVLVGEWLLLFVYALINSAGAALYVSGLDPHAAGSSRRRRIVVLLTVLQLPAGVVAVMVSPGGTSPTDRLVGDEDMRSRYGFSRIWRTWGSGR